MSKRYENMKVSMLKSKIHRAIVTEARPDYIGSITIDKELLKKAGIYEYEKVLVADVENGSRLWTYTIAGESGSGVICLNGAAARLAELGDHVIIMSFAEMSPEEAETHRPKVVFVDEENNCNSVERYEIHGELFEPCIE